MSQYKLILIVFSKIIGPTTHQPPFVKCRNQLQNWRQGGRPGALNSYTVEMQYRYFLKCLNAQVTIVGDTWVCWIILHLDVDSLVSVLLLIWATLVGVGTIKVQCFSLSAIFWTFSGISAVNVLLCSYLEEGFLVTPCEILLVFHSTSLSWSNASVTMHTDCLYVTFFSQEYTWT